MTGTAFPDQSLNSSWDQQVTAELRKPSPAELLYEYIFPSRELCSEEELYVRIHGTGRKASEQEHEHEHKHDHEPDRADARAVQKSGSVPGYSFEDKCVRLIGDATADFLTYFNAFTPAKWLKHTNVRQVSAFVELRGSAEISVTAQDGEKSLALMVCRVDAPNRGVYVLPAITLDERENQLLGLRVVPLRLDFGTDTDAETVTGTESDADAETGTHSGTDTSPVVASTSVPAAGTYANIGTGACAATATGTTTGTDSTADAATACPNAPDQSVSATGHMPPPIPPEVTIYGGGWLTDAPETRDVHLGIAITTFRREKEVKAAVSRLTRDIAAHPLYRDRIDVTVVDNGNTLKAEDLPGALLIPNRNLGGTGGFTRGLIHYQETGRHTHCLFMDDDASCEAGSVFRSMSFQRHATDPLLALSGAMLFDNIKFMQWENGAWFDGGCHSVNRDFDLRDPAKLWENEQEGCVPAGKRIYGAWWFFFFPLSGVKNYSLPFFVRGDDIDFSYANDFHVASLNGVSCWQQDFKTKESPLTAYLFLRSHLVHHMTLPQLKCSFGILWKILWGHFRRYNASYFYGTAAAVNLAMSHVLKGPKFFEDNIEPTEVLRKIKEISQCEKTESLTEEELKTLKKAEKNLKMAPLTKTMRRLTFNGHLLPKGMAKNTAGEYLPKWMTPNPDRFFRRSQVTVTDQLNMKKVVLRRSPGLYFKNLAAFLLLALRLRLALPFLKGKFRKAEEKQRSREFWKEQFRTVPAREPDREEL